MNLREKLEYLMEKERLNKADLSKGAGISYTTIDGILKRDDFEKIKLSTLNKLKKYFDVTLDYLIDDNITDPEYGKTFNFKINFSEMNTIKQYRLLSDSGKETINKTINNILAYEQGIKEEIENSFKEQSATRETIRIYHSKAAAGIPLPIVSDDFDEMDKADYIPQDADFGIILSGDSMEPKYPNGCVVWVKSQPSLEEGDIGVFIINDESVCKKLHYENGQCELVSLNSKYKPIKINEYTDLRVVGKVVGYN